MNYKLTNRHIECQKHEVCIKEIALISQVYLQKSRLSLFYAVLQFVALWHDWVAVLWHDWVAVLWHDWVAVLYTTYSNFKFASIKAQRCFTQSDDRKGSVGVLNT